jgi:Fur family ferric uptake transcriptional regulator
MPAGLTKRRKTVLEVVSASAVPLSAAQVMKKTTGINLATVYRALQFLEKSRYLTGFTIPCEAEGVVRYYAKSEPHSHFLHCEACHAFFPFLDCDVPKTFAEIERRYHFLVQSHALTFFGICGSCRKVSGPARSAGRALRSGKAESGRASPGNVRRRESHTIRRRKKT